MATFKTRDGVRLAYTDWGTGSPVVFLASWSLPGRSWAYQTVPLVEAGYRCITLDRRGHGRSEDPGRGYEMDSLADDIGELLVHLDLWDATLVGFSMGGAEAVRTAVRHPERIGALALVGTTTPYLPAAAPKEAFEAFYETLVTDLPHWVDENAEPFMPGTSAGMKAWVTSMVYETSPFALLACNRTLTTEDSRPDLPKVAVPTLVLHGENDGTSPLESTGRPTAEALPNARLEVFEEAPHGLMYTHRERFNAALLRFLGERPSALSRFI